MSTPNEIVKGLVFEIQKMSTEDGPGIRTTVFFKQCPLHCAWCHNPESIQKKPQLQWLAHKCIKCDTCLNTCKKHNLSFGKKGLKINRENCVSCGECAEACPSTALSMWGKWWNLGDLFHEIEKDKIYYLKSGGGITVSGGEPTIQLEFLEKFLKMCKDNGISTALDTCGYGSKKTFERVLPYSDLVLLDIKEIDSKKHEKFCGVPNDFILENAIWMIDYLEKTNKKMWIRTPLIPNYTATDENVRGIGEFIVNKLKNKVERWDLLAFNNLCVSKYERLDTEWCLKDQPLMTKEEMEHFQEVAKSTGAINVQWSGLTKRTEEKSAEDKDKKKMKLSSC